MQNLQYDTSTRRQQGSKADQPYHEASLVNRCNCQHVEVVSA